MLPFSNESTPLKAFTHLCAKANFSVMGNALTLYCDDAYRVSVNKLLPLFKRDSDLSSYTTVHRKYPEHEPYHLDSFDRNQSHYHFHFNRTLDNILLAKILNYLIASELITKTESENFLVDFQQANLVSGPEFEHAVTQICFNELKSVIAKNRLSNYTSPRYTQLKNELNAVVANFEQLLQTNTNVYKLRKYMRATFFVLNEPTKDNLTHLETMVHEAKEEWPILSVNLRILGSFYSEIDYIVTQICIDDLKSVVLNQYSSKYVSPQYAELKNIANAVIADFERLSRNNMNIPKLRQYMRSTFFVLNKPTRDNLTYLETMAHEVKKEWPILSVSLLILGAALLSLSFSLGIGVAGAVVGMLGLGVFTSGGVGLYQRKQSQDVQDQGLSQNLSALSVRLAS